MMAPASSETSSESSGSIVMSTVGEFLIVRPEAEAERGDVVEDVDHGARLLGLEALIRDVGECTRRAPGHSLEGP